MSQEYTTYTAGGPFGERETFTMVKHHTDGSPHLDTAIYPYGIITPRWNATQEAWSEYRAQIAEIAAREHQRDENGDDVPYLMRLIK